ncbi:hypothetical protein DCS_06081 [Drechmeria coniospora]|uniref:Uncharacterized protein n=1 Tax=Drechmeria coniospora TaxID=98403 RepID=A0A151GAL6_DRECN|nr:hypothetical protein DCS_06081 [Drechmeria coniospora]KYK54124.1 hypothetical protein DCS_06081 [Drechmeria coniospora]
MGLEANHDANDASHKQSTIIQGREDLIRGLEVQVQESKEEFQRKSDVHDAELKQGHRDLQREVAAVKERLAQLTQNLNASEEVTLSSGTRAALEQRLPTLREPADQSIQRSCSKKVADNQRSSPMYHRHISHQDLEIVCGDEAELQMVKEAAQKTAVEGSRVMRDQLYPVRADNANSTAILDADGSVLPGAIEALSAENRVTLGKISWLSKRESGKAYGSMVVYVTEKRDAERLLEGYYFDLAGEAARRSVTKYIHARSSGHAASAQTLGITTGNAPRLTQNVSRVADRTGH